MNDTLIPFNYGDRHVRVIQVDGEPWFVAADVCGILGYANGRAAVEQHVPERHRGSVAIHDGTPGNPNRATISESGLYRLVMRSNALNAEPFQDWVTESVLPEIRRTGGFKGLVPTSFAEALELAAKQSRELEAAAAKVAELEPSARAWDVLADTGSDFSVREAAHILSRDPAIDTGQFRLFQTLREFGVIGEDSRPYQAHTAHVKLRPQTRWNQERGERVPAKPQVRVTVAGLRYLHKRLGGTSPLNLDTKDVA